MDIVSDRGIQFTSQVWKAFCKQLDINVSLTSGYHPQSNGQVERLNQEIGRYLWSYCSHEQHRWAEFLSWAEYAQNSLKHSSTGITPFQCVLGYQPPKFPWSGEPSMVQYLQSMTGYIVARRCGTSCTSAKGCQEPGGPGQYTTSPTSSLPTWTKGLALHTGPQVAATKQETKPKVCRPI